ncbi:MAG TPA: prolyl oligopeptidase family serine peptidase [Gammaproteobacteria bacterium]|nr:prolyl oligopeptidase family serine peptidase [Gammaproteobacteria bacterium]
MRLSPAMIAATLSLLLASCQSAGPPEDAAAAGDEPDSAVAEVEQYPAAAFFETTSYAGASFSHDGELILLSSDESGIFNAASIPFGGGEVRRLTDSVANAIFAVRWFPDDRRFLYTFDEGGNELNHLYVREEDGSSRDLTPGAGLKARFGGFSEDGGSFWVLTNERDPKAFDLYGYETDGYGRELVFRNDGAWEIQEVSRDGQWVSIARNHTNADSDIYLWNARDPDRDPVLITAHEGDAIHNVLSFSPDSRRLFYATNAHGEFAEAWRYDLSAGRHERVLRKPWDVDFLYFSEQGRYRVTGVNADARTEVEILDTRTGERVPLPELPPGDVSGVTFSRDETRMALYLDSSRSPSNLHVVDLDTGSHRQLTDALNPAIDTAHLVEASVVRYASYDGLEIPAVLYRPHQAKATAAVPALVWVHGGPGGQSRLGYSATIQHLVNHGYGVLAVNNRGSSGYGKTFFHLDDRRHGDVDLKDVVAARSYLESLYWVDGGAIGIIGGSYGGYMVAAALAFAPQAFDVGIDIFGVTNWVRTLESIPPWWESFRVALYTEMGDPAIDAERHRSISPLFHAAQIERPLLVVQGANDPRVLQVESDELVAAVRANGVPVEYLVFDDEGHGFLKRENRIAASEAYLRFLDAHL